MEQHANGKVLVERDGPVTIVTVNRPDVRNACDRETVQTLHDVFHAFEQDDEQRVGVLTGAAGGGFCAGADLSEVAAGVSNEFCWAGKDKGAMRRRMNKPFIAAVEGHAVAAGMALAVWCDMRVASESAVFGVFCRRFGGPMPNGTTVRLPRIVGESRALDILMTGRPINAEEAMRIGLADRLVPEGQALAAAKELAHTLAGFPQLAMLSDRMSASTQWDYPEEEAIDREIAGSMPAMRGGFQSGAGRFTKGGVGRHGKFE